MYIVIFILYTGAIMALSLTPIPDFSPDVSNVDKVYHFSAYTVMAVLLRQAMAAHAKGGKKPSMLVLATAVCTMIGLVIEGLQTMVPGRTAELGDFFANGLGALLGSYLYGLVWLKLRRTV